MPDGAAPAVAARARTGGLLDMRVLLFLLPFVLYGAWLGMRRLRGTGGAVPSGPLPWSSPAALGLALVGLGISAIRRRPAGRALRAAARGRRPHRPRPFREGGGRMSDASREALAALLADPATAPVLALLDRDGEAARVVGGAVRDALLRPPARRHRHRHDRRPRRGRRRARPPASRRCRPASITAR